MVVGGATSSEVALHVQTECGICLSMNGGMAVQHEELSGYLNDSQFDCIAISRQNTYHLWFPRNSD